MNALIANALACAGALFVSASFTAAHAQPAAIQPIGATPILPVIAAPDTVQTSLGTLHYEDGAPSPDTVAKGCGHPLRSYALIGMTSVPTNSLDPRLAVAVTRARVLGRHGHLRFSDHGRERAVTPPTVTECYRSILSMLPLA